MNRLRFLLIMVIFALLLAILLPAGLWIGSGRALPDLRGTWREGRGVPAVRIHPLSYVFGVSGGLSRYAPQAYLYWGFHGSG